MSKKINAEKNHKITLILAALICAVLCILLCACNRKTAAPKDTSPCYDISLDYDGTTKTLSASQEILYTAPANSDCVVLHVYANAFDKNHDVIDVLSAQFNRQNVEFEIYGEDRTLLRIPCAILSGETYTLSLKYEIALPVIDARLGITERGDANLTCFYPVIARFDSGWREDTYADWGDPFYCDIASYYVDISLDESLSVAASGEAVDTHPFEENGAAKKRVEFEAENIRDFGMVIGNFQALEEVCDINGREVAVDYVYYDDTAPAETLARAASSLSVFSETFGDYPYPTYTVAQSSIGSAGGMEYGAFVLISPSDSREVYLDTVTHETAHQWWYNAVGSDQINSAWLDEGLTEFCTYYYHYLTNDRSSYSAAIASMSRSYASFAALKPSVGFNGKMNRPLDSYLTEGEYVAVTYCKGALLFDALRSFVGDKKFQAALSRYYSDNLYSVCTQDDLIAAFKTQGYDVSSIIYGWVDDRIPI